MGQILVWECEDTQQLFREEKEYRAHRRAIAREKTKQRKAEIQKEADRKELEALYRCKSLVEIQQFIMDNQVLILRQTDRRWSGNGKPNLVNIEFHGIRFGDQSCSHSAPLGKRTNWSGHHDAPRRFPGWAGTITLHYSKASDLTDALKTVGICTGSGGGGGTWDKVTYPRGVKLKYEVKLWLYDFPELSTQDQPMSLHAIRDFKNLSCEERAKHWSDFTTSIDGGRASVPEYARLMDTMRWREAELNLAAHFFGQGPYAFHVYASRKHEQELESLHRHGEAIRISANSLIYLHRTPDLALEWMMRGDINPDCIVDLKARADRLRSEGLLTSLPEPSPNH